MLGAHLRAIEIAPAAAETIEEGFEPAFRQGMKTAGRRSAGVSASARRAGSWQLADQGGNMGSILGIIIIGFVAGIIARIPSPGPNNPTGFVLTTALGVAGACRRARTDAGGALGREALDAGAMASDAKIKPGKPGERSTATPEALDAVPCRAPRRAVPPLCRDRCRGRLVACEGDGRRVIREEPDGSTFVYATQSNGEPIR